SVAASLVGSVLEDFQRQLRGFLFRFFLAPAGSFRDRLPAYDDFHLKQLAVIGTDRPREPVLRQRVVARLQKFLQPGFVILADRATAAHVGDEWRELPRDERPRMLD